MATLLRSALLSAFGFAHGFALRSTVDSGSPSASADREADPGAVLCQVDPQAVGPYVLRQVHGRRVVTVGQEHTLPSQQPPEADGLSAGLGRAGLVIRTADCLPLVLADPRGRAVAAVHAGWRGLVAGVVDEALHRMQTSHGVAPAGLIAVVFPHIRGCCFEIGADVAEPLRVISREAVWKRPGKLRPHGRLEVAVRKQLLAAGVPKDAIDTVPGCTVCDASRFYSYRRDGRGAGRHLTVVVSGG